MNEETLGVEALEVADPVTESVESPEVADPEQEGATPEVTAPESKSDAAFAAMRRENEELKRQIEQEREAGQRYEEALGLFFNGDDKVLQAQAYADNRPFEDVKAEYDISVELEQARKEANELKTELANEKVERQMSKDLTELQKIDPNIKSIDDLGQDFLRFRFSPYGEMTPSEAYYAMKAYQEKTKIVPPRSIGKLEPDKVDSDFYTREEVQAMSREEVSKNYAAIRKSMQKW